MLKKPVIFFYYLLLFSPIIAYVYMAVLGLPKTNLHSYTYIAFLLGLSFVTIRKNINVPNYVWLYFIYSIYRLFWQQYADTDFVFLTHIYYSIHNLSTFLIIVIIANTKFSTSLINRSISVIKVFVILGVLASIIQVFKHEFLSPQAYLDMVYRTADLQTLYGFRRLSFFGFEDLNSLGLSYIPLISIFIGHQLINKRKNIMFYVVLVGITAVLSNTRYIMIAFLIISLQYFFYYKFNMRYFFRYVLIFVIVFLVIYNLMNVLGYNVSEYYAERLFKEGNIKETTRYMAWDNFLLFFNEYKVWGTGVHITDEIRAASQAIGSSQIHVGYLSHILSYGLVGSFFLFGFWFTLAYTLFQTAKKTNYWGSFFAFLTFFWAQATLVQYTIFYPGLIIALVFDKYYSDLFAVKIK